MSASTKMVRGRAVAAATLAAALLAACGGGGGNDAGNPGGGGSTPPPSDSSPPSGSNYFPLAPGARWVYADYANGGDTPSALYQLDTGATTQVDGHTVTSLVSTSLDANPAQGDGMRYLSTASGVTVYPGPDAGVVDDAIGPFMALKLPATVGDSFVQFDKTVDSGYDDDGDGVHEKLLMLSTVQVIDRGPVSTPAGTFPDALHLRTTLHQTERDSAGPSSYSTTFVQDIWLVDGVGRVRATLIATDDASGTVTEREHTELQAYRVGSAHGGPAPTLTSFAPADAQVHPGSVAVTASFSMPMDPASLSAGGLVVTDAAGHAVAGQVTLDGSGRNAVFVPGAGWPSGVFTAKLTAAATDREGNAATPQSWTFTLDTTAPALALATPAAGASGVASNATATFVFSEPLYGPSVWMSAPTFTVMDTTTGLPADVSPDFDSLATITVKPRTYWTHGHTYTVTFPGSFADLVGNTMGQPASVSFSVAPGVFGAATPLAADIGFEAVQTIADIDGDGRPDQLWASWDESVFPPLMHLYVRHGQADGSLGPVTEPIPAPVYGCTLERIAAVDLNGDGLPDLVLGGACGMRIYRQQAGGSFTLNQTILLPNYEQAGILAFQDFDGDGRVDMLSAGDETYFHLWHQDASGQFVDAGTVDAGIGSIGRLRLVDVDGDGVPDLVVSSAGSQSARLSVLRGIAGGGFGPPTTYDTGDGWPDAVSVADVDGDGRPDIVLAIYGSQAPSRVQVLKQRADHSFVLAASKDLGMEADGLVMADVDGDGRLDAIVAHPTALGVLLGRADGTFGPEDLYDAPQAGFMPGGLGVGVNPDGREVVGWNGQVFTALASSKATPQAAHRHALATSLAGHPVPRASTRH
ncbi:FG-GAP-like repeat-containing protein [Scleromatobacter humisilvae]|uniref:FG-GAP-like repeat-containing protein n=1 Tax=Scleromatobacter humisilvae TaxID=2897159 RepID=A0A9X1YH96_9BURK|nr:FG-GAP-like repeat-containing protein [Scleromatobacter humisilvae]MCK9684733.1 FG-GAP-like repeat-containing protein [Scleromatobacter humisilvae]